MITYTKKDNSVQAYFGRLTDNDDAFYLWYHEPSKYFNKHMVTTITFYMFPWRWWISATVGLMETMTVNGSNYSRVKEVHLL